MRDMNGKDFDDLAQRSVYYFLATYPSFYPVVSSKVSESEQREAYEFIKGIYTKLYDDPAILGFKFLPDDSFEDKEQQKDKPKLVTTIRKPIKKIEEFIGLLHEISLKGTVDGNTLTVNKSDSGIKPSGIRQLAVFGVQTEKLEDNYRFSFPVGVNGLKLLAEISVTNAKPQKYSIQKLYLLFSRGVFDIEAPWSREVFGNMLSDRRPFNRLIDFLERNGYQRIDNKEYVNNISLDYIKNYGDPGDEVKPAWAERTHSGIEVIYEELRKNQFTIALRLPYFKEILQNSDRMNERVKRFILTTNRKCDGCRYCVQTDKSGKRPLSFFTFENEKLCPLFPGFQYRWKTLDDRIVDDLIEMLNFIDELFAERRR